MGLAQNAFKRLIVSGLLKERQSRHGSIQYMVNKAAWGDTCCARHASIIYQRETARQRGASPFLLSGLAFEQATGMSVTVDLNPFVQGTPYTPNIPDSIAGGADAFGLTIRTPAPTVPAPAGAVAAAYLVPSFPGYDLLLFTNLTNQALSSPKLGVGNANYVNSLLQEGYANNPLFGGPGAQTLPGDQLGASRVYETLVPEGDLNAESFLNASVALGGNTYAVSVPTADLSAGAPVYLADTITSPSSTTVNVGDKATFFASSTFVTDTVQWYVSHNGGTFMSLSDGQVSSGGAVYSGVTTGELTITGTDGSLNGNQYEAIFNTAGGPVTTMTATLTVNDDVVTQPVSQTIDPPGGNATFTAASAYATDTVQWYASNGGPFSPLSNGGIYSGVTSDTLTIANPTLVLNDTQYKAVFTQRANAPFKSSPATLHVDSIITQPRNQYFVPGQTITFTAQSYLTSDKVQWGLLVVNADGSTTFQPLSDDGPYSGTTTSGLTIVGATADMAANEYQAEFSNGGGSFFSGLAAPVRATVSDIDSSPDTAPEGAATGTPVGITAATTLDNGSGTTYSLLDNAGGRFAIDPTSGVVTVTNGTLINYATAKSYQITVEARDASAKAQTGSFQIAVTDVAPSVPMDSDPRPNSVPEQATTGALVGITVVSTDLNPVTYSLTNDDSGTFTIDPNRGVVTVANGSSLDYAAVSSEQITVEASDAFGANSTATFTIHVTSTAAGSLTIGGISITDVQINGTTISGNAMLPFVGSQPLSGTILGTAQAPQYSLTTAPLTAAIDGQTLTRAVFTLSNSGLNLAGGANLPMLGNVQLNGAIQDATDFRLAISTSVTLGAASLTHPIVTYSPSGVGFEADATLPVVGAVHFAGTIQDADDYNLTASVANVIKVGPYGLTNVTVTLSSSNAGANLLGLTAHASLPLVNTVSLSGNIQDAQDYSFSASVQSFALGAVTLTNVDVSLSSKNVNGASQIALTLTATADLPLVGSVQLSGAIQDANDYGFTATANNLKLGGFSLTKVTVGLTSKFTDDDDGGVPDDDDSFPATNAVTLTADATLPLVGTAHLNGVFQDADHYSLEVDVPNVALGAVSLTNASVGLSSTRGLTLSGAAKLPFVGSVDLSGQILDASHFSLSKTLGTLAVGGFSLTNANIIVSDAGVRVVGDATLPVIGTIRNLQGQIQDANDFTLTAPLNNLQIGKFTLKNDSVTLQDSAGVISLMATGTANLPVFGSVTFTGTINPDSTFTISTPLPNLNLFSVVDITGGTLTLGLDSISVHADAKILNIGDVTFAGTITADGNYQISGTPSINVAGFQIQGAIVTLGSNELNVNFDLPVPDVGTVTFGGSYGPGGQWSLTGTYPGPVQVGPVTLTDLSLTISNTSLTVSAMGDIADLSGLVNAKATIQIFYNGDLDATLDVHVLQLGGFSLGQAEVGFGNTATVLGIANPDHKFILALHAHVGVPIPATPSIELDGFLDSSGNYDLKGSEDFPIGGLTLTQAQFELSKANGFSFSADWNYVLFVGQVSGTIGTDGHVHFQGDASLKLGGFTLSDVHGIVDLNPKANTFTVDLSSHLNVYVATANFTAHAAEVGGVWQTPTLTTTTSIGGSLASVLSGTATFTITPSNVTFTGSASIPNVAGGPYSVNGTINADGTIKIGGFLGQAGALLAKDVGELAGAVYAATNDVAKAAAALYHNISKDLGRIAGALESGAAATLRDIGKGLANIGGLAYSDIAKGLSTLTSDSRQLADALANGAGAGLHDVAKAISSLASQGVMGAAQGLAMLTSDSGKVADALVNGAGAGLHAAAKALSSVATIGLSGAAHGLATLTTSVGSIADALANGAGADLHDVASALSSVSSIGLSGAAKGLATLTSSVGSIADALANGAGAGPRSVAGALSSVSGLGFAGAAKGLTTLTNSVGAIADALANGAGAGLHDVAKALSSVATIGLAGAANGLATLTNSAGAMADALANGAGAGLHDVAKALSSVSSLGLAGAAQGLATLTRDSGLLADALVKGAGAGLNAAAKALSSVSFLGLSGAAHGLGTLNHDVGALTGALAGVAGAGLRDVGRALWAISWTSESDVAQGLRSLGSDAGQIADALQNGVGADLRGIAKAIASIADEGLLGAAQGLATLSSDPGKLADALANGAGAVLNDVAKALAGIPNFPASNIAKGLGTLTTETTKITSALEDGAGTSRSRSARSCRARLIGRRSNCRIFWARAAAPSRQGKTSSTCLPDTSTSDSAFRPEVSSISPPTTQTTHSIPPILRATPPQKARSRSTSPLPSTRTGTVC
jgi:hypothetical protein